MVVRRGANDSKEKCKDGGENSVRREKHSEAGVERSCNEAGRVQVREDGNKLPSSTELRKSNQSHRKSCACPGPAEDAFSS